MKLPLYVDYDEDGVDSTRVFAEFTGSSLFTTEKIRHFDEKASLADVFQYLRQVSEYKFVYDSDAVKQFQPVSVDLKGWASKKFWKIV